MKPLIQFINENNSPLSKILNSLHYKEHKILTSVEVTSISQYYNLSEIGISIEMANLNKSSKYISIDFIKSKEQNKGAGTEFFKDICKWADETGTYLCLNPTDIYVGKNNLQRLINFYKKFNFEKGNPTPRSKYQKEYIRYPKS